MSELERRPVFYAGITDSRRTLPAGDYCITAYSAWKRNRWQPPYMPRGARVLIDCGAYSAYLSGRPLPFDLLTYVTFIRSVQAVRSVKACATIDVIGDVAASEANAAAALERWPDLPWIATAHGLTDPECVASARRLHALGFRYIGLSCLVVGKAGGVNAVIKRIEAVAAALPDVRLHLWGVGLRMSRALEHKQVESHDTTAWYPRSSRAGVRADFQQSGLTWPAFVIQQLNEYRASLHPVTEQNRSPAHVNPADRSIELEHAA